MHAAAGSTSYPCGLSSDEEDERGLRRQPCEEEIRVVIPDGEDATAAQGIHPSLGLPHMRPARPSVHGLESSPSSRQQIIELAERLRRQGSKNRPADFGEVLPATQHWSSSSQASLEGASFKPQDTVILFDWDDTLFPTWFVVNVILPCSPKTEDAHRWQDSQPLPETSPFLEPLRRHAETVKHVLLEALQAGRVGIVTLAQRPWVESSALRYLPGLDLPQMLQDLDIPVIYARECLKKHMTAKAQVEEGVCLFTMAKQEAMKKVLKKLYGKNAAWKNVLSIGDSTVERNAITEVLWAHEDGETNRMPSCKTVKLMEEPSVEQLNAQLLLLSMWLRSMASHHDDFDVVMDDSEESMISVHNQFAPERP